jgi:hypothetical protein
MLSSPTNSHCSNLRVCFLDALIALLSHSHPYPIANTFLSTRILKSLLPCLSNLLAEGILPNSGTSSGTSDEHHSAKAKKKAKMYEGDEVFRITKDVLLRTSSGGEEVLATLHRKLAVSVVALFWDSCFSLHISSPSSGIISAHQFCYCFSCVTRTSLPSPVYSLHRTRASIIGSLSSWKNIRESDLGV